jgi:hypothetical protein
MTSSSAAAVLGLAISFALPTFAQQNAMVPDRQVIEQLDALGQKYEAYTNNDAAALAALYTWGAVIVTPQGPVYGRDTYHPSFLRSYYHVTECAHDDINADHENPRNRNH